MLLNRRFLPNIVLSLSLVAPRLLAQTPVAPAADAVAAAKSLQAAATKAEAKRAAAQAARERIVTLALERKQALAPLAALRSEVSRHFLAARSAQQKYERLAAARKPDAPPTPTDSLELSQTEYRAGVASSAALQKGSTSVAALEAELDKTAAAALADALEAKNAALEATTQAAALKARAEEGRKAALAAQQEASRARSASGFYSAASYLSAKARSDKQATTLATDVATANQGLAAVTATLKAARAPLPPPPNPNAWRQFYPAPPGAPSYAPKAGGMSEDALLRRLFGKYLAGNQACPDAWAPGLRSTEEAFKAGMFQPQIVGEFEGPITRPKAQERLYLIFVHECSASHAENWGTRRYVIFEGNKLVKNVEGPGAISLANAEDVNGDGVLDFVEEYADMHQGIEQSSAALATFAGGNYKTLEGLGGATNPCAGGEEMVGNDATIDTFTVSVKQSPKLEFRVNEKHERCFPKAKSKAKPKR